MRYTKRQSTQCRHSSNLRVIVLAFTTIDTKRCKSSLYIVLGTERGRRVLTVLARKRHAVGRCFRTITVLRNRAVGGSNLSTRSAVEAMLVVTLGTGHLASGTKESVLTETMHQRSIVVVLPIVLIFC
jgi:hypothetical protein